MANKKPRTVTKTTKVTTQSANKKRSNRRRPPVRKVQVKVVRQNPQKTAKRTLKRGVKMAPRATRMVNGSNLTKEAKMVALNTLLPYEAPPIRIREDETNLFSVSTAVCKHFNFHDIDLTDIIGPTKVCGVLNGGARVWPNLETSMNIVSILDARIYAIVPSFNDFVTFSQLKMQCRSWMNNNQTAPATLEIPITATTQNTAERLRLINGGQPLHLFPNDFRLLSGSADALGLIHPAIDFEDNRYIWMMQLHQVLALIERW